MEDEKRKANEGGERGDGPLDCLLYPLDEPATVMPWELAAFARRYNELVEEKAGYTAAIRRGCGDAEREGYERLVKVISGQLHDLQWAATLLGFGMKFDHNGGKLIDFYHHQKPKSNPWADGASDGGGR